MSKAGEDIAELSIKLCGTVRDSGYADQDITIVLAASADFMAFCIAASGMPQEALKESLFDLVERFLPIKNEDVAGIEAMMLFEKLGAKR